MKITKFEKERQVNERENFQCKALTVNLQV